MVANDDDHDDDNTDHFLPDDINTPQDLTKEVFTKLIHYHYYNNNNNNKHQDQQQSSSKATTTLSSLIKKPFVVTSISMKPINQAILSQVMEINVCYDYDSNNKEQKDESPLLQLPPTRWIVKFLKSSLPLEDMFCVESTFYKEYAPIWKKNISLPFDIPSSLYCSNKCIIIEKVYPIKSYTLLQSLPYNKVKDMITILASIHRMEWNKTHNDLSDMAGIGNALSGLDKEHMYPKHITKFLNRYEEGIFCGSCDNINNMQQQQQEQEQQQHWFVSLCHDLCNRRLQEIHDKVHEFQPTLIHGDFHVGNFLFPIDNDDNDDDGNNGDNDDNSFNNNKKFCTLIDWATCGQGNPMIDLVFFFLVSTKLSCKEFVTVWLPYYYKELTTTTSSEVIKNDEFSFDKCKSLFRTCLLNQFIILVCYDDISRTLLMNETTKTDTDTTTTSTTSHSSNNNENQQQQEQLDNVREHYMKHFDNVNTRCIEALLSNEMNLLNYSLPSKKTKEDLLVDAEEKKTMKESSSKNNNENNNNNNDKNNDNESEIINRI